MEYFEGGLALALTLCLGGGVLHLSVGWGQSIPASLRLGASYFVGLAAFIFVLRLATIGGLNTVDAIYLTQFMILGFLIFLRRNIFCYFGGVRPAGIGAFFGVLLVGPMLLLYWLPYTLAADDINALVGSLHSGRYVNLANYFLACNYVPIVGQNTGQSLLVAALIELIGPYPFVYLFALLLLSVVALALFVFGILRAFSASPILALLGMFVFMMGNASLSSVHVMSIDSGSPFGLNGYTDTLLGVFVVLMLLVIYSSGLLYSRPSSWFFVFILVVVSFLVAPQNVVLLLGVVFLFTLIFLVKLKQFDFKSWWMILFLSFAAGIPLGGMLTPASMKEPVLLPGVQSVSNSTSGIEFEPWLPFYVRGNSGWAEGNDQTRWFKGDEVFTRVKNKESYWSERIYYYEQTFWMALRNLFFPLLGLFVLHFWCVSRNGVPWHSEGLVNFKHLCFIGYSLLLGGILLSYPFSLNDYKLELSRFLIPVIAFGLLALSIQVTHQK